jgi:hypothetical protein
MSFDPWNHFLKIRKSIATPILKVRAHLGVWGLIPSHSSTLSWAWNVIPRLHSWPTPLQALALVTSPRLRLWHWGCYIKMGHLISHVYQPTPSKIGIHILNSQNQFLKLSHLFLCESWVHSQIKEPFGHVIIG